jgi:hypothetical protein
MRIFNHHPPNNLSSRPERRDPVLSNQNKPRKQNLHEGTRSF